MTAAIRPRKLPASREAPVLRAVLGYLEAIRIWHWRNNSGSKVIGEGSARRMLRMSPAGSPDILLVIRGRLCGLEVKSATGKQSPSQAAWERKAIYQGVGYAIVRSVGEAKKAIETWTGKAEP